MSKYHKYEVTGDIVGGFNSVGGGIQAEFLEVLGLIKEIK